MAIGSQKMAYKEVAVRRESGHVSGELSTEKLSQLALGPVLCRLKAAVLGSQLEPPEQLSLEGKGCLASAHGVGGQASEEVKEEPLE